MEDPNGLICRVSESVVVDAASSFQTDSLSPQPYVEGALERVNIDGSSIMFEGIIEDAHFDTDAEDALTIELDGQPQEPTEPILWDVSEDGTQFTYRFGVTLDAPSSIFEFI